MIVYMHFLSWGLVVCSTIDQFDHYENITVPLSTKDKQYIEETTGCFYPCTYLEYKVSINYNRGYLRSDALL